jgi:tetratricopeptide (TPR) repeat protein
MRLGLQSIINLVLLTPPVYCLAAPPIRACDAAQVFQRSDDLLKVKDYREAKSALNQLQGCTNLSPIQTFNLGWLYGRAHDSTKALKIFQAVPPDVPDRATHQYAIALSEFELGNYQGAVDALKGLRTEGLLDARGTNLLGVSYSKLGLYQDAYPILLEALRQNPSDLFAYLNLVTLLTDTGNFKNAAEVAEQAVVAFPQNPDALVALGAVNVLLGNLEKSHSNFAAAVAISPRRPDAQFLLALSDYKQGDYANAMAELTAALGLGINDSDLHYLLAECILKVDPGKTADALAELDRAIGLNSRSVSARTLRGKLLLESGKPKRAVQDLELAHQLDPASRSALYNLARADSALGKTEQAKALFKQMNTHATDPVEELSNERVKNVLKGDASE